MQKGVVRKRRTSPLSEYGRQLREKQELKEQYNLRERQFSQYIADTLAKGSTGNAEELFMQALEKRLDNVVFRMGMAQTRKQGRQLVAHGHFFVNGRVVDIPSYRVKRGDVIEVRPQSAAGTLFQNVKLALKKYQSPSWIQLDKANMKGEIMGEPGLEEIAPTVQLPLVFEFYSR